LIVGASAYSRPATPRPARERHVHDDQFDAGEALISVAVSMAAVAALAESRMLLSGAWVFGALGLFTGLCGFAGWGFHPDVLSSLLG
jgi:hypothetical protein